MYNSPFKNKGIDKIAGSSNMAYSGGTGDGGKVDVGGNIVKKMNKLDAMIAAGEAGTLSIKDAKRWKAGELTKEKRELDLKLKANYPEQWKSLHSKGGETVVGTSGGSKKSQYTSKEVGVMTGKSKAEVEAAQIAQAKRLREEKVRTQ